MVVLQKLPATKYLTHDGVNQNFKTGSHHDNAIQYWKGNIARKLLLGLFLLFTLRFSIGQGTLPSRFLKNPGKVALV